MSLHVVTKGATNTRLRVTLLDATGTPVDLTDSTVTAHYTIDGTSYSVAMTIDEDEPGTAEHQWTSDDFENMAAGDYPLQFRRTVGSAVDFFPMRETPMGGNDSQLYDTLRVRAAVGS